MKRIILLTVTATLIAGCGARAPIESTGSPSLRKPAVASQSLPTWMSACLSAGSVSVADPPAGSTPQLTSETATGTARAWDSLLTTTPAAAAYMHYVLPSLADGTAEADALSQPLWAVGFGGLHWALPGLNYSATSTGAEPYMSGLIVFIDDLSNTAVLEFDCPS